jgi:hypothetical protein
MMSKTAAFCTAPLLALALAGTAPAQAQGMTDGWQFEASIYGWFPAIGGSTSFPATGTGPNIDVSAKQVIDALKFTFMGSFEARKGQWGLWTDLVYADFGASKSRSRDFTIDQRPVAVDADLQLDVKSWIWTLAGTYNLTNTPDYTMDLLGGVRYLDLQQTLGWTFSADIPQLPGRNGTASVDFVNWDGIVGLKGRANLGAERRWFIPYYADIGTGQSKLTWQVNAGVGYQFDWGSVIATWRYLDYEFKSDKLIQSMSFNGPTIGVAFRW